MVVEALAALLLGLVVLGLVLQPVFRAGHQKALPAEPIDPEETSKGIALTALKEIEFDRETGKLSDADYEFLKAKYTALALEALKEESEKEAPDDVEAMVAAKVRALRSAPAATSSNTTTPAQVQARTCVRCGPRPESDAIFCSACGCRLPTISVCHRCGALLSPDSRFCEGCGQQVAA
jgi:rRNA maturation endonuclease Nob1